MPASSTTTGWSTPCTCKPGPALLHDDGARAYHNELRARDMSHNAALRQLGNRLVGILHGCLKTGTLYNQATAWSHRYQHLTA